jgi:hypothetical protein
MADVCGPFTLDQLDQFGTVDSITLTFDSPLWQSADTCILSSSATVSALASTTAQGNGIFAFFADVTGTGFSDATASRIRSTSASINGIAIAGVDPTRVRFYSASIVGDALASAFGGVVYSATANITGIATAEAFAYALRSSSGNITGICLVSADGEIIGENWTLNPIGNEVWAFSGDGICGPFTLDQLDIFGGVDDLPYSLDDVIYLRSDFCANAEIWNTNTTGDNTWLRKG